MVVGEGWGVVVQPGCNQEMNKVVGAKVVGEVKELVVAKEGVVRVEGAVAVEGVEAKQAAAEEDAGVVREEVGGLGVVEGLGMAGALAAVED